jgi:CheY-like chemotaxis protein
MESLSAFASLESRQAMRERTILVVDEHPSVCALLAKRLDSLGEFRVIAHTTNRLVAAELAHLWSPDIIVADFQRRGSYGAQMYRWLKANSPASRLVVLTSYFADGDRELYEDAGASRCLTKGASLAELQRDLLEVSQDLDREPEYSQQTEESK